MLKYNLHVNYRGQFTLMMAIEKVLYIKGGIYQVIDVCIMRRFCLSPHTLENKLFKY